MIAENVLGFQKAETGSEKSAHDYFCDAAESHGYLSLTLEIDMAWFHGFTRRRHSQQSRHCFD